MYFCDYVKAVIIALFCFSFMFAVCCVNCQCVEWHLSHGLYLKCKGPEWKQDLRVFFGNPFGQSCAILHLIVSNKIFNQSINQIIGTVLPSLQTIYTTRCRNKAHNIIKDTNHPSNTLFQLLPSKKRYQSIKSRTTRLVNSFVPQAVRLLNS